LGNAETKLQEAEYFLTMMRSHTGGTQEFMFNLSACLTAARSVMDVLLYDYGCQYGLFTLNDKIHADDFQRLATSQNHHDAVNFYSWWTQKVTILANDPIAGFLSKKRHILVHRGRPGMAWSLILAETISFSSSFVVSQPSIPAGSATPHAMDVTAVPSPAGSASPLPQSPDPAVPTSRHSLIGYFTDYPQENAIDLCQKYLAMLSSIITEARTQFP
jgi:hypothetical protein